MKQKYKNEINYWRKRVIPRIIRTTFFYICYPVLFFVPIKRNKIVVSNFNGQGYG
ncbi:CDP-glycerol--poly(glycerophosphate) glycerophosphotransferase, partial [Enterococcus faecalis]